MSATVRLAPAADREPRHAGFAVLQRRPLWSPQARLFSGRVAELGAHLVTLRRADEVRRQPRQPRPPSRLISAISSAMERTTTVQAQYLCSELPRLLPPGQNRNVPLSLYGTPVRKRDYMAHAITPTFR